MPIAYFSSYEGHGYRPHDINLPFEEYDTNPTDGTGGTAWFFQLVNIPQTSGEPYMARQSMPPNPFTETEPHPGYPSDPSVSADARKIVRYRNPQGFQLIAAGEDGLFGPGGKIPRQSTYPQASAPDAGCICSDLATRGASYDNVTNVSGSVYLGNYNDQQLSKQD